MPGKGLARIGTGALDPALATAAATAVSVREQALVPETRAGYRSNFAMFTRWCDAQGRTALPADAETVALFLFTTRIEYATATHGAFLTAIRHAHRTASLVDPTCEPMVELLRLRLVREKGIAPVKQATPIRADDMELLSAAPAWSPSVDVMAARNRTVFLVGYHAALPLMRVANVRLDGIIDYGDRIELTLRKGRSAGETETVTINARADDDLCPVAAVRNWRSLRPAPPADQLVSEGLLFGITQCGPGWPVAEYREVNRTDLLVSSLLSGIGSAAARAGWITRETDLRLSMGSGANRRFYGFPNTPHVGAGWTTEQARACVLASTIVPASYLRLRAAILLQRALGGVRGRTLVELQMSDLEWVDAPKPGLKVTLRHEKTDSAARKGRDARSKPREVFVPYAMNESVCALLALHEWLALRGDQAGFVICGITSRGTDERSGSGAPRLKVRPGKQAETRHISSGLRSLSQRAGITRRSVHGVRAGFITDLAVSGLDADRIAELTGQHRETVLRYVRLVSVFDAPKLPL